MKEKERIEQELQQILSSRLLENKKQACNFLAYIMDETLAGRGERITQYGIAIEALGKPADYCPTENPAVRVEAGRVRRLLEEYYAGEGQYSPLRISLPVGSYQPAIDWVTPPSSQAARHFEPKSIQSLGPKIHISCQNPAHIRDDTLRGLVYNMRSVLPMTLGNFREVRIALAHTSQTIGRRAEDLDYAWQQHQAEFLLQCSAEAERTGFVVKFTLLHTLSRETVWADTVKLPLHHTQQTLEAVFSHLILEAFSLHRGVALSYWSRYWKMQDSIPGHYQVLVEHISFIQDKVGAANIQPFLQACQTRTQCYHDDALAHLHYAVLCLYAYMFGLELGTPLESLWHRLALKALELNPGNALAHSIFALECYHRGDNEMGQVEIETARHVNPFDTAGGHLTAVGLCALGHWENAFTLLRDVYAQNSSYPEPLRTIPCLFYFRRGEFIRIAKHSANCHELGGWETFGKMSTHCRTDDCKGCVQTLSQAVDHVTSSGTGNTQPSVSDFWGSIQRHLSKANPPGNCGDTLTPGKPAPA